MDIYFLLLTVLKQQIFSKLYTSGEESSFLDRVGPPTGGLNPLEKLPDRPSEIFFAKSWQPTREEKSRHLWKASSKKVAAWLINQLSKFDTTVVGCLSFQKKVEKPYCVFGLMNSPCMGDNLKLFLPKQLPALFWFLGIISNYISIGFSSHQNWSNGIFKTQKGEVRAVDKSVPVHHQVKKNITRRKLFLPKDSSKLFFVVFSES